MNKEEIKGAKIRIQEMADIAASKASKEVLTKNCHVVNATFGNRFGCASPDIKATMSPYKMSCDSCTNCDHMVSFRMNQDRKSGVVFCLPDDNILKNPEFFGIPADSPIAKSRTKTKTEKAKEDAERRAKREAEVEAFKTKSKIESDRIKKYYKSKD